MARAMEESFFLRIATVGLSSMVITSLACTTCTRSSRNWLCGQRRVDFLLPPDEIQRRYLPVRLQRALDAFNDHPAAVVATHDIDRNAHRGKERGKHLATPVFPQTESGASGDRR